jgi:hypothetical protein
MDPPLTAAGDDVRGGLSDYLGSMEANKTPWSPREVWRRL